MLDLAMRKKDELQRDFTRVIERGVSMRRISDESGISYTSLRQYKHDEYLGEENRRRLSAWLDKDSIAQAILSEGDAVAPMSPESARDVCEEVGILLYNLSQFMRNARLPLTVRAAHLRSNIQTVAELVPEIEREAREADERQDSTRQKDRKT
jgi:hypothetical protein